MKLHPYFVPVALALALAACRPAASEYSEAEAPKGLRLDNATTHFDLQFAPGSTRLVSRDSRPLRALVATGGLQPADRVLVATGGSPGLARARYEAIANELAPYRIVATPKPVAVGPNHAIVQSVRYLEGTPAAAAVNRYLTDKVQLPTAASVGPIAAQPSAAPAAPGGTTGSTP